jgi:hypothetical protein
MTEPEPFNLPGRLRGLADDFTSAPAAPDHLSAVRSDGLVVDIEVAAQLREAADALEQRLGLLRDTERRLHETVQALDRVRAKAERWGEVSLQRHEELRIAELKIQELELSLRKRQATVDRQGHELGKLRAQPAASALAHAWATIETSADATACAVAASKAALVPHIKDLLLSPSTGQFAIRDPQTGEVMHIDPPEAVVVGETECGPVTPSRTISSGADLAAWLREDGGPDDPARIVLDGGRLIVQGEPAGPLDLAPEQAIGECPKCGRYNGPDTDDCLSYYCELCRHSYGAPGGI